ncbi:MAG: FeoA family protein [Bacteroidia bacterium]
MTLLECPVGFIGELIDVHSSEIELYLLDLGIDTGCEIEVIGKAPLGCPVIIQSGNLQMSIRKHELQYIHVKRLHAAFP